MPRPDGDAVTADASPQRAAELPEGWAWTTLESVYKIVGGGTPSTGNPEFWNGDIPWITSADISGIHDIRPRKMITPKAIENSATNLVPKDSLIVVTRVSLGKIAIAPFQLCFSQDSHALIGDPSLIDPNYALYYLSAAVQIFKYQSRGTTIAGVTKKQLAELALPLPPLAEQRRIVAAIESLFTKLDAGVAELKRAQANLRRYKASVLKAACEGRLVSRGAAMPRPHSDDLPAGWRWATFGEIFTVSLGGTPSRQKPQYWNGEIPWVSSGEVAFNRIKQTREKITAEGLDNSNAKLHPSGTVLLAMIGEGKTRGQAAILDIPATTNQNVASILCFGTSVQTEWLFYWLQAQYEQTRKSGSGGMQYALNSARIKNFAIAIPPLAEQRRIVAEVERRLSMVAALEQTLAHNLARAEKLRQAILKKAFAGRLIRGTGAVSAPNIIENQGVETPPLPGTGAAMPRPDSDVE